MSALYIPSRLFKYLPPDRVGVLSDGLLRYSPLGAFNDPLEGRPDITAVLSEDELQASVSEVLADEINQSYASFPSQVTQQISKDTYSALITSLFRAKEEKLRQNIAAATPIFSRTVQGKFDEIIGVLCLSEVPDSLLMWAHYASSHTGFVLEFDAHHAHFNEQKSAEDEFRHLRRVLYRDARPSGSLTSLSGELFTVKSTHWAYEREWRILRPLPHADRVMEGAPFPVHLFLPPSRQSRL